MVVYWVELWADVKAVRKVGRSAGHLAVTTAGQRDNTSAETMVVQWAVRWVELTVAHWVELSADVKAARKVGCSAGGWAATTAGQRDETSAETMVVQWAAAMVVQSVGSWADEMAWTMAGL
jgi:hypothetical protein